MEFRSSVNSDSSTGSILSKQPYIHLKARVKQKLKSRKPRFFIWVLFVNVATWKTDKRSLNGGKKLNSEGTYFQKFNSLGFKTEYEFSE